MKRRRILDYIRSRRTLLILAIVVALALAFSWCDRYVQFYFDAHHQYENANFFHWCAGWFGNFDLGPLYASVMIRPDPHFEEEKFNFTNYRWHIDNTFPQAGPTEIIKDREGLRIAVTEIPASNSVLINTWHEQTFPGSQKDYIGFHRSNRLDGPTPAYESESAKPISSRSFSMNAWTRTDISYNRQANDVEVPLGKRIELPTNESPRDWAFRIQASGRTDERGYEAEVFVAYDVELESWRIYDRDWKSWENINSWIKFEPQTDFFQ